jgi:hypothetical protein
VSSLPAGNQIELIAQALQQGLFAARNYWTVIRLAQTYGYVEIAREDQW